jgi:hypothetical protein
VGTELFVSGQRFTIEAWASLCGTASGSEVGRRSESRNLSRLKGFVGLLVHDVVALSLPADRRDSRLESNSASMPASPVQVRVGIN